MSYKYLNEHPRGYYQWGKEEKKTVVLGAMELSIMYAIVSRNRISHSYTSQCVIVAVSQRTLPIMLLINERKKEKKIRCSNRESNLVVMIFRILLSFIV